MRFEEKYFQKKRYNLLPLGIFILRALSVVFAYIAIGKIMGVGKVDSLLLMLIAISLVLMQILLARVYEMLGKKMEFSMKELTFQSMIGAALLFIFLV